MKHAQADEAWEKRDKVIICKTNFAQEWVIEANKNKCTQTIAELGIPAKYWCHQIVFSEQVAKHFPLA
jgi:hypothetical protein